MTGANYDGDTYEERCRRTAETRLAALHQRAARARTETAARDRLIVELRSAGVPLRTIAEAAGITHTQVANIARRQTGPLTVDAVSTTLRP